VAALRFTLQSETALLRVRIYDASGRLVRTLTEATLAARTGTLLWDGLDDAGRTLRIGIYVVHLEAVSAERGTTEAYKQALVLARTLN
jgi:flagellar hook assembly protein FlgD